MSNDELTLSEVSRITGATSGTVARWCRSGRLPGARLVTGSGRGFWLVPRTSAEAARKDVRGRKRAIG